MIKDLKMKARDTLLILIALLATTLLLLAGMLYETLKTSIPAGIKAVRQYINRRRVYRGYYHNRNALSAF